MSKSARDYRRQPFLHSEPLASFKDLFPAIQTRAYEENQRRVNVDKRLPEPPFHVFCFKKKILLTCLVSVAGLLSPMSGSIYFPAITAVVEEFGINGCVGLLTVTVHVVVHGIAPFLSTPLSERWGRRPILIAAMLVFSGANIGLVFVKNLAGFFLLRALQSLGAAPLPLIGAAIIGDMATTEESRTLTTLFSSVLLLSLLISPVIGGALTQWMGLHCMFWFLFALSAVVFILVIIILPETHRGIAGNGTIKLAKLRQPLFNILRQSSDTAFDADTNLAPANLSISSFIEPLRYLVNWQLVPSLLIGAVAFGIVATVVTTTAPLFQARYNLSILLSGLAYLPGAVGCSLGYFLTTYRVRSDYSIIEARYKRTHGIAEHVTMDASYLSRGFPIEHARFRSAWWITLIFIGTTSGYGFALQAPSIARALILQTFVTGNATAILLINGVYISDLYPGASVITIVNLVRFLMAGLMIGVIQKVFKLLETGLTFSILAGIMLFLSPIMILQWKYGPRLREKNHESSEDLADMLKPIV
ncbi:major facilitator superfamily domain-containing protein [Bisporella sp. PMI_857]|nr:major facilitator superfamily domain-containing protein [Bisporella sp. PMI_857]